MDMDEVKQLYAKYKSAIEHNGEHLIAFKAPNVKIYGYSFGFNFKRDGDKLKFTLIAMHGGLCGCWWSVQIGHDFDALLAKMIADIEQRHADNEARQNIHFHWGGVKRRTRSVSAEWF